MGLHPLNRYARERPNFAKLAQGYPAFEPFVQSSTDGSSHIDFQEANALRALTTALLKEDWDLDVQLREDRLCPTLASRLEYLFHVLDLEDHFELTGYDLPGETAIEKSDIDPDRLTAVLDIGTGHAAIYPLLLHRLRPQSTIIATESDQISFDYAQSVLETNGITSDQITLLKAQPSGQILFPLNDHKVDIVICNPPFYASLQELEEGMERKEGRPHAAPTAANNELITRGGETAFVGKMILESTQLKDQARWYTSLIGIYSSLGPLVDLLRTHHIENYFIQSIRPAKTARWIIGWSFGHVRLPDNLTRPEHLTPGTSYAKLLSPLNSLRHTPQHPPLSSQQLRDAVFKVLGDIRLGLDQGQAEEYNDGRVIRPKINTWSRAARRQAARDGQADMSRTDTLDQEALFTARLSIIDAVPPSTTTEAKDGPKPVLERVGRSGDWRGATLVLHFLEGKDRAMLDSFWKFILTKAELLGENTAQHPPPRRDGEEADGERYVTRGRGRERGIRGGRRGRGRIGWG